ncbi:cohesin loading factor [Lipomyces arxii]|uniref:cohesin loading factor n=1 Tax=Lipomyces arxii TaxID=56418 RepID=UPI0034CECEE2
MTASQMQDQFKFEPGQNHITGLNPLDLTQIHAITQTNTFSNIHLIMFPAAREYFDKAHAKSTIMKTREDVLAYFKLIATGIRCLEAVIGERTQPYIECLAVLWYSETVFLETKQFELAEEALNKAISLAGRNNLYDVKFTMVHLLVKILATTNTRAAQKLVNTCLKEAEMTGLETWIYTFQYLRASLHFSCNEYSNVISNMKPLSSSRSNEIRYMAQLASSLVHLRQNNPVQANECLIEAAKYETEFTRAHVAQLVVMRALYEALAWQMLGNPVQAEEKVRALHACLDNQTQDGTSRWVNWQPDGTYYVVLPPTDTGVPQIPLRFQWWSQSEVYVVSCLLSGMVCVHTSWNKRKASKFFAEGIRVIDNEMFGQSCNAAPSMTLQQASDRIEFFRTAKFFIQFYACLEKFVRGDWSAETFPGLVEAAEVLPPVIIDVAYPMIVYLGGMFFQARGQLRSALEAYSILRSTLNSTSELSILATLGMISIYRGDTVGSFEQASILMSELEPIMVSCSSKKIQFAWTMIKALDTSQTGLEIQNMIAELLTAAREIGNSQFTTIVMYLGASVFSDKAKMESSALGAFLNAKKCRDVLWCWVTGNLSTELLQQNGKELMAEKQKHINKQLLPMVDKQLNSAMIF